MTTAAVTASTRTNRASANITERLMRSNGAALVAVLTLIAFIIRVHRIGAPNLWLDESNSWLLTTYPLHALLANVRHSPGGPFYFILLKGWTSLFGPSEAAMRSLSLLVSLPLLALTYMMGVRAISRPAGVIAALLLAVSPLQLYFAQEARVYMLATLAAACTTTAYVRWRAAAAAELTGRVAPLSSGPALAIYAISAVVSLYTLGLTALLLAALGIDALLLLSGSEEATDPRALPRSRWRVARPWAVAQLAVLLGALPLVLALDPAGAIRSQAWRGPMGTSGAVRNLIEYFLVAVHGLYFYPWDLYPAVTQHWGRAVVTRLVIVFPLTILAIVTAFAYPPARSMRGPARALWLALLVPVLVGTAVSIRHELSLTRYMLFATPYLALLLAGGLARAPRWIAGPALAVLLASATYGLSQYPSIQSRDTDFRPVARELADSLRPTDIVLVQPPEAGVQLAYYLRGRPIQLGGVRAGASLKGLLRTDPASRMWIALDYRSQSYNLPPDSIAAAIAGSVVSDRFDGSGDNRVRLIHVEGATATALVRGLADTAAACCERLGR